MISLTMVGIYQEKRSFLEILVNIYSTEERAIHSSSEIVKHISLFKERAPKSETTLGELPDNKFQVENIPLQQCKRM